MPAREQMHQFISAVLPPNLDVVVLHVTELASEVSRPRLVPDEDAGSGRGLLTELLRRPPDPFTRQLLRGGASNPASKNFANSHLNRD